MNCPDEFLASHKPTRDSHCMDFLVSMDRQPILRVAEIQGEAGQERS
jgi:hypothetical protein